ncbi:MAG: hypothetical protein QM660_10690 [Dysgonomonas sp.]
MNDKNIEEKCCAGCKIYTGGEVRHLPECVFYPESLSRIYDEKDILLTQYKEALRHLVNLCDADSADEVIFYQMEHNIDLDTVLNKAKQLLNNE